MQDGGDEAEWRLLWPTPISLVIMAGRLCKPIGGASMVLERGARISGEITD